MEMINQLEMDFIFNDWYKYNLDMLHGFNANWFPNKRVN